MASNEQSVTLLRRNKAAIAAALAGNGYEDFTSDPGALRMSGVPDKIRMGASLLDLCVAVVRISDGQPFYFTVSQWQNELTAESKALFAHRGLRVRCLGESFILSLSSTSGKTNAASLDICNSYKAHTEETDGIEDTLTWTLPTMRQLDILYRWRTEINAALTAVWNSGVALTEASTWSRTPYGSGYWWVHIGSGYSRCDGSSAVCRPVSNLTH